VLCQLDAAETNHLRCCYGVEKKLLLDWGWSLRLTESEAVVLLLQIQSSFPLF
jgi:hypothetical protein